MIFGSIATCLMGKTLARSNNNSWHRKMTNPTNLAIPPY